jgi:hypothetical protein
VGNLPRGKEFPAVKMKTALIVFLAAAFVSFLFSVSLWFGVVGDGGQAGRDEGLFVGIWVPSILALGNLVMPRGRS